MSLNSYKCLKKRVFENGSYRLIPIRQMDKYKIMKWRNEQLYHLRQESVLTRKAQDLYFKNVIQTGFRKVNPNQILFSFLKNKILIGYGGLVHIDWKARTAEVSFLIDTEHEEKYFQNFWKIFIDLIESIAFNHLSFHKIYTFSYNLRPKLYKILKKLNFFNEKTFYKTLSKKVKVIDSRIDSKYSNDFKIISIKKEDVNLLYKWANEFKTRKNSVNSEKITKTEHLNWFNTQIKKNNVDLFFAYEKKPVGLLMLEEIDNEIYISYNVSKDFRGKGIGSKIINHTVTKFSEKNLVGEVLKNNLPSIKIFRNNGFVKIDTYKKNNKEIEKYIKYSSQ